LAEHDKGMLKYVESDLALKLTTVKLHLSQMCAVLRVFRLHGAIYVLIFFAYILLFTF